MSIAALFLFYKWFFLLSVCYCDVHESNLVDEDLPSGAVSPEYPESGLRGAQRVVQNCMTSSAMTLLCLFLLTEFFHYLLGFIACAVTPGRIPEAYFPTCVRSSAGTEYLVRRVLSAFYLCTTAQIAFVLWHTCNAAVLQLSLPMALFFLWLLTTDILSLKNEGRCWTYAKAVDMGIHVSLLAVYTGLLFIHSSEE